MLLKGSPIRYLNVESDVMKDASIKSILDDNPVWFGCDVGKHFHRDLGIMDTIYLIMKCFIILTLK